MAVRESGLNITLSKTTPATFECGGELVEVKYSKRCSATCIMINIDGPKKVAIGVPYTIEKLKNRIAELETELANR